MSWAERAYGALLRCYPAEFRSEYTSEMTQAFRDRRKDEPGLRLWLELTADVALTAPREQCDVLRGDLQHAFRMLRRAPLFTTAVVLTLALGIGASTAVFSVVNAEMLRPLPFSEPDRLVWVAERNDKLELPTFAASALNYQSWKEQTQTLRPLGAIGFVSFNLSGQGEPEQLAGSTITPSLFPLLGIQPLAGRAFEEGEDKPGSPHVAMISEALWRRRFGADGSVIGRSLTLDGADFRVIGVTPPALAVIASSDIWVPLLIDPSEGRRLNHVTIVVGRLKEGVSIEQAQAEMDTVARRVGREHPEVREWGIRLVTFSRWLVADQVRTSLLLLLGAVFCLLLIACANVAHLLLARGLSRAREIAVRAAMGASRGRLLRQLVVESLVLSLLGGAAGLLAAVWAVRLVNASLPANLLPLPRIEIDQTVLIFAIALSVVTGLLFGVVPAWRAARVDLSTVMKQAGRSGAGGARPRLRSALAAAELALATVLVIGAGLLVQSVRELQHVDLGFRPEGVLTFQVSLPPSRYALDAGAPGFYDELLTSLRSLPGVVDAAVSSGIPFGVGNYTSTPVSPVGKSELAVDTALTVDWRLVSPDYFRTLGIPVLKGRVFTRSDDPSGPPVIILSQSLAKAFWGAADPVGRTVRRVADGSEFSVVGVVGDTRNTSLNQQAPAMYFSSAARVRPLMDVLIRAETSPESLVAGARAKVTALDRDLPISNVRRLEEWVANGATQPRLNAGVLALFAGMALLIAAIGTSSVLAYSVSQRTAEIALRMALGARRGSVVGMIVREGMTMAALGIGSGILATLVLGRALGSLVFGVSVRDPMTFAAVAGALAAVALVACVAPAHRASRVNPMIALRHQ